MINSEQFSHTVCHKTKLLILITYSLQIYNINNSNLILLFYTTYWFNINKGRTDFERVNARLCVLNVELYVRGCTCNQYVCTRAHMTIY